MMRHGGSLKKKRAVQPTVPMRGLFWAVIPSGKIGGTIWKNLSDAHVKVDAAELEAQFAKKPSVALSSGSGSDGSGGSSSGGSGAASPQAVQLLDGKRQQNGGIVMKKLGLDSASLEQAVLAMDPTILTADNIALLLKLVPTKEEKDALLAYSQEHGTAGIGRLSKVDRFVLHIAQDIPRYAHRLECMALKLRFDASTKDLRHTMDLISTAMDECKTSKRLRRVLEVVLAVGNYMNGSTTRGGAYGFKLNALEKLPTVKASNNKDTLLTFLVRSLDRGSGGGGSPSDRDALALPVDLSHVARAARVSLQVLRADTMALAKAVRLVSAELDWVESQHDDTVRDRIMGRRTGGGRGSAGERKDAVAVDGGKRAAGKKGLMAALRGGASRNGSAATADHFVETIGPFATRALEESKALVRRLEAVEADFKALAESFAEVPTKVDTVDFFGRIAAFVGAFAAEARAVARETAEAQKARRTSVLDELRSRKTAKH